MALHSIARVFDDHGIECRRAWRLTVAFSLDLVPAGELFDVI
jgi:hypothetical protein